MQHSGLIEWPVHKGIGSLQGKTSPDYVQCLEQSQNPSSIRSFQITLVKIINNHLSLISGLPILIKELTM